MRVKHTLSHIRRAELVSPLQLWTSWLSPCWLWHTWLCTNKTQHSANHSVSRFFPPLFITIAIPCEPSVNAAHFVVCWVTLMFMHVVSYWGLDQSDKKYKNSIINVITLIGLIVGCDGRKSLFLWFYKGAWSRQKLKIMHYFSSHHTRRCADLGK